MTETAEENRRLRRLLALQSGCRWRPCPARSSPASGAAGCARSPSTAVAAITSTRLTAVIAPDGLIGRVVDVRPGASVVQVLTDPASTVGAHVVRTRTPGIVEGEPRGTMRFKYMARDGGGLQVGDLVVTSGSGGLFPRGIPIGRVRAIDDRGSALFHYAQLAPAVDFARIDEVLLIVGEGGRRRGRRSFRRTAADAHAPRARRVRRRHRARHAGPAAAHRRRRARHPADRGRAAGAAAGPGVRLRRRASWRVCSRTPPPAACSACRRSPRR